MYWPTYPSYLYWYTCPKCGAYYTGTHTCSNYSPASIPAPDPSPAVDKLARAVLQLAIAVEDLVDILTPKPEKVLDFTPRTDDD